MCLNWIWVLVSFFAGGFAALLIEGKISPDIQNIYQIGKQKIKGDQSTIDSDISVKPQKGKKPKKIRFGWKRKKSQNR
jgi:hypothetical protein